MPFLSYLVTLSWLMETFEVNPASDDDVDAETVLAAEEGGRELDVRHRVTGHGAGGVVVVDADEIVAAAVELALRQITVDGQLRRA